MLYLALAYAVFFVVLFVYILSLSRRQHRVEKDLVIVRQALERGAAVATSPQRPHERD